MVADDEEEYFPRGGSSGKIIKKKNFVFEKNNQNKEPKKKLGKRERNRLKKGQKPKSEENGDNEGDEEDESFNKYEVANEEVVGETRLKKLQPLSYHTLTDGLVTLCSVNTVLYRSIQVCLPERLMCSIDIRDISTPLKELDLKKNFRVGDIIACKIKSKRKNTPGKKMVATCDPAEVNSDLDQNDISVGCTFPGAVKSQEDHGYMIFSGVSGLNAFLPFNNCPEHIKNGKNPLAVGKLVWCKVVKCTASEGGKNVQVSIKDVDFNEHQVSESAISDKSLLPGMKCNLTVTKHLGNDLEVSIDGVDSPGFVPHTHLKTIACVASDIKIGTQLKGTVLYKYPLSNVTAFSLRVEPTSKEKQVLESGEVFERAEIVSHHKRGLGVRFHHDGNPCYGVISKRRMEGDLNDKKLEELFPKGNHIKVVVVGYHHIDQLYSCSTEDELLSGKYLTMTQLRDMVGKIVTVVVKEIKLRGAVVMMDSRTAFVPSNQVTDTLGSQPLKKLQINSKHKGRILRVIPENNSIVVTLRPTLISNKPLVDFGKVAKGDTYYGCVSSAGDDKINVAFFNGLNTAIFQENLIQDSHKYQVGELVKCFVVKPARKWKAPIFSLVRHVDQMLLSIGETYKLIVKGTSESAVECLLNEKGNVLNVSIPLQQLCDDKNLWQKVRQSLSPGATIDGHVFCFDSHLNPIFTLRESVKYFFQEGGEKLRSNGCAALKIRSLIPVIIWEEVESGFYVSVPVPNYNSKVLVTKEVIQRYENAKVGDVIWLSIENVNLADRKLHFSYPTFESDEKQLKHWAVSHLRSHVAVSSAFVEYKSGDRVTGVATGVRNGCVLPDGKRGLIETQDKNRRFDEGQELELMVLLEDLEKGTVHLAEWNDPDPSALAGQNPLKKFATVFSCEKFFVGKSTNGSICFCPTIYHPNSSKSDLDLQHVVRGNFLRIDLCHKDGDLQFGVPHILRLADSRSSEDVSPVRINGVSPNGKTRKNKKRSLSNEQVEHGKKSKLTLVSLKTPENSTNHESNKSRQKKLKRKSSDSTPPAVNSLPNDASTDPIKLNRSPKKLKKDRNSLNDSNPLLLTSEY